MKYIVRNSGRTNKLPIDFCVLKKGTNDGKEFQRVTFNGWKLMNGKQVMSFTTTERQKLTINPSFHTFTIEDIETKQGDNHG